MASSSGLVTSSMPLLSTRFVIKQTLWRISCAEWVRLNHIASRLRKWSTRLCPKWQRSCHQDFKISNDEMPKLLLATSNSGKIREYRFLLDGLGYQVTTLAEEGITKVVTESGNSYDQNARSKAVAYAKFSHLIALADDSGLEVEALNGR